MRQRICDTDTASMVHQCSCEITMAAVGEGVDGTNRNFESARLSTRECMIPSTPTSCAELFADCATTTRDRNLYGFALWTYEIFESSSSCQRSVNTGSCRLSLSGLAPQWNDPCVDAEYFGSNIVPNLHSDQHTRILQVGMH